jgi:aspartate 1-decarboxylase
VFQNDNYAVTGQNTSRHGDRRQPRLRGVDKELIDAAGLARYELVHVVNINTGSRLETYVIEAPAGSGTVCLNGAAARLGAKGDKIIILAYAQFSSEEARWFKPAIVHVDKDNKVVS